MGWYLGTTRIFVTDEGIESKNIIARLQPLSGGSIHQTFGYENDVFKIKGYIVGATDLAAIRAMAKSSSTYALKDFDETTIATVYVLSANITAVQGVAQTLRPDLDCDAPVYIVDLTLYE